MTIAFPCESCGHRFEVDGALAGRKCRCKHCGHVFLIPVPYQPKPSKVAEKLRHESDRTAPIERPKAVPPEEFEPAAHAPDFDPYGLEEPDPWLPPPVSGPRACRGGLSAPENGWGSSGVQEGRWCLQRVFVASQPLCARGSYDPLAVRVFGAVKASLCLQP